MARPTRSTNRRSAVLDPTDRRPPESFVATLSLQGQEFPFRLFCRPVRLGEFGTVQYYWMDSSQFRSLRTAAEAANFRAVVGFWYAGMQHEGVHNDLDNQIHYILAVTYALVCRRKSLQNIVLDAYLLPDSSRHSSSASLPQDIRDRIHEVAESRDRMRVQEEVGRLLKKFTVPQQMLPPLQEAFRRWVGRGVVFMRQHGDNGVEQFLVDADYWMQKLRKKSDRWVRHFLDLFAYECKAAFHTCYANAWVGLLPWLREHRGLDDHSERFMRLWHYQNQPIEIPHGRTAGGIHYPTRRGIAFQENNDGQRQRRQQSLSVATEQIGPTHVPDVLLGQVLSLHPLSAFFMKDPALCAIAGRFFTSDAYLDAQNPRLIRHCSEYWQLIEAILTATHVYRQAVNRQAGERGTRTSDGAEEWATHRADDLNIAPVFEDYARGHRLKCSQCGGGQRYVQYTSPVDDHAPVQVDFSCVDCGHRNSHQVALSDLEPWLKGRIS